MDAFKKRERENVSKPRVETSRVQVTRIMMGLCHMQVCAVSDATDDEILNVCNSENPSGTTNGWSRVHRADDENWGKTAPVACEQEPGRFHYVVAC